MITESSNTVSFLDEESTWEELANRALDPQEIARLLGLRVMFLAKDELEAVALVACGIKAGLDFGVMEHGRLTDDLEDNLEAAGVFLCDPADIFRLSDTPPDSTVIRGRISVLSSGTTGLPKLIPHTAESLNTFDRVRHLPPHRWFVPYQIGSYAWYQMLALGRFVEGQNLVLGDASGLMDSFRAALQARSVTAISSTPTFWRQAAMSIDPGILRSSGISSVSLGGEIVDQPILDYLKELFPGAIIKHIFASSEAGAAIVVSDGMAGFDAKLLEEGDVNRPVAVRIVDGRLNVRSRYGNTGEAGGWIDTGDLVEQIGERVFFRGRANNTMINVGGQKAFPAAIEAQLLTHPDVVWARVSARRAPLVGSLPQASVVLRPGLKPEQAEVELTSFCLKKFPEYAVPRFWSFLDSIPLRASLKS